MSDASGPAPLLLRIALLPNEVLGSFGCPDCAGEMVRLAAAEEALRDRERSVSESLFELAGPRPEAASDPGAWKRRNALLAVRRDVYNRRPYRGAALEAATPAIPEDVASALAGIDEARAALVRERRRIAEIYRAELARERRALVERAGASGFREGVWLANRSLRSALDKLDDRDPARWRNEETHVALAILAYLGRAAAKTSPNSLFCATAPVSIGADFRVDGSGGIASAVTRLNVFEARKVAACLAADSALRPALRPRPNPTLRRTAEGWTYWRPPTLREEGDEEVRSEIGSHPVLARVLERCATGTTTWDRLRRDLAAEVGLPSLELERFLETLTGLGVLLAELEVPYNEPRPLAALVRGVRKLEENPPWLDRVAAIEEAVDSLPPPGSPDRVDRMTAIGSRLAELPHVRPLEMDALFRVDAASGFRIVLPGDVVEEIASVLDGYARLFTTFYPPPSRSFYAASFLARFPPDREVPLLDLYRGFEGGSAAPPLASFPEPTRPRGKAAFLRLQDRVLEAAGAGEREVRLSPEDVDPGDTGGIPPRWTAGALVQIAPPKGGDLSSPRTRFVLNGIFPGVGLAYARFHLLHDPPEGERFARAIREGLVPFIPEGAMAAELTYTHWGRTANASLRPRVFRCEIELPGDKATPGAEVVPLADLTVRYDSAEERFRVRSLSRRVDVVPVLSSGVRPEGFVDFLVHVGMQDLDRIGYFPGFDREGVVRWPRVTVGRTVLFRERWVFGGEDGPAAYVPGGTRAAGPDWFRGVQRWRDRHGLPRRVFAASAAAGKPFYVDLASPLFTEGLRRALAGGDPDLGRRLVIAEMFPGPENLWIRDARGSYASEFLLQVGSTGTAGEKDARRR